MDTKKPLQLTSLALVILTSLLLTVFYNIAFLKKTLEVYPLQDGNFLFLVSLGGLVFIVTAMLLSLFSSRLLVKPILVFVLVAAGMAGYFMDSYNVVINTLILRSALETTSAETADLITWQLVAYAIFLCVVPAVFIIRVKIKKQSMGQVFLERIKFYGLSAFGVVVILFTFSDYYTSFFREHKSLRYYVNPLTAFYSLGVLAAESHGTLGTVDKVVIGEDAKIPGWDKGRELVILVVGETVRADHISLNGYGRPTMPLLASQKLISYTDVTSCGTATAISVPCMFSLKKESEFEIGKASNSENLLNVLNHAGVSVLWRDNNTGSQGVLDGIQYQNFTEPTVNPSCDIECRDEGMLVGLESFIAEAEGQDIVIVLHQMGNHGPAYYKRYPEEFKKFLPVCETNQLEDCDSSSIVNAYDNALLYTDFFLNEVIEFLKPYDDKFETAMLYMSDHGESLGEYGLYLHGLPNFMAPASQRKVGAMLWLGAGYDVSIDSLMLGRDMPISHDNYFHTVLGLMEIETDIYDAGLDLLRCCSARTVLSKE
ncbi:phosphoethanolamine--lipid A transferase [Gammaproteobacteria bacterium]|nr:phosphoethanolamine--lipid A transferase [Gammaproteobacteria bacterium]